MDIKLLRKPACAFSWKNLAGPFLAERRPPARRSRAALAEDEYPIFALNEQVRAVYKARQGGVKKYKGMITGVLEDNVYNITYEDGDTEQGVHARYVLRVGSKLHDNTTPPDVRRRKKPKS